MPRGPGCWGRLLPLRLGPGGRGLRLRCWQTGWTWRQPELLTVGTALGAYGAGLLGRGCGGRRLAGPGCGRLLLLLLGPLVGTCGWGTALAKRGGLLRTNGRGGTGLGRLSRADAARRGKTAGAGAAET